MSSELLPSLGIWHKVFKKSSLIPLDQFQSKFVWIINRASSFKIIFDDPASHQMSFLSQYFFLQTNWQVVHQPPLYLQYDLLLPVWSTWSVSQTNADFSWCNYSNIINMNVIVIDRVVYMVILDNRFIWVKKWKKYGNQQIINLTIVVFKLYWLPWLLLLKTKMKKNWRNIW